jgi:carboxyl-terminal processing protease
MTTGGSMKSPVRIAACLLVVTALTSFAAPSPASQSPSVDEARDTDANVTRLTTGILGQSQFSHHPLDSELAARLLDRYLDALDGSRMLFLQSDIAAFASYRATLAHATLAEGDTSAAHAIFSRYLDRLRQQVAYDGELLRAGSFDFSGHDVYSFDRAHAARPADLAAARSLWRQQLRAAYLEEKLADKKDAEIATTLAEQGAQRLQTAQKMRGDEILAIYLDALAHVYDPHSDYLGREEVENLAISMNLSLFGIGASLDVRDGYLKIHELMPGGPALRSGLLSPGDRIVAVAEAGKSAVDVVNMPLARAVTFIRGPKGSTVTLTVLPAAAATSAAPRTVSLVRGEIKLEDQEAKASIVDLPRAGTTPLRLGVIDLPSFYANMGLGAEARPRSATTDVGRLLQKLKAARVQGVVMDLRHNGGGSLQEAVTLTGLFIRRGPVVQTRDPSGAVEVGTDDDDRVMYDGPLVLLTSRFSASATEILAGALQDYGRAVVVGDRSTFGKGTVQSLVGLAPLMDQAGLPHAYDPGALKVTISKFYRPSGASTQLRGVASDIVLPSTTDFADVSEAALDNPLPWDVIPAASFEHLDRVQPYVAALRAGAAGRVKAERAFAYLADDIDRAARNLATKHVSLNEAERRAEIAYAKVRREAMLREDRATNELRPVTYPITLRDVDRPGLPAPVDPAEERARAARKLSPSDDAAVRPNVVTGSGDDPVLDESVRILSDYVGLLSAPAARAPVVRT